MGIYFEFPVGAIVHEHPKWEITGGYLNQDTGEVSL